MGNYSQDQQQGINSGKTETRGRYRLKLLRKVLHSTSGVLALIFFFFPHKENIFIFALSVLIIVSLSFDMLRLTFPHINEFVFKRLHFLFVERDRNKINSAIYYFMGCLITIIFFPVEYAAIGILFLSIGDTAAAVGGMTLKRWVPFKIPGTSKTIIGSFTFIVITALIALLLGLPLKVALISAVVGAVSEAIPIGVDDNFTIPFFSTLSIWTLMTKF